MSGTASGSLVVPVALWGRYAPSHQVVKLLILPSGNVVTGSADGQLCIWKRDDVRVRLKVSHDALVAYTIFSFRLRQSGCSSVTRAPFQRSPSPASQPSLVASSAPQKLGKTLPSSPLTLLTLLSSVSSSSGTAPTADASRLPSHTTFTMTSSPTYFHPSTHTSLVIPPSPF